MHRYLGQIATQEVHRVRENIDIVGLKPTDFPTASEHLSAAFKQDPLISYFLPEENRDKQNALRKFSAAFLKFAQSYNHIYTTSDNPRGVAIWMPPEAFEFTWTQVWKALTSGILTLPFYLRWNRVVSFLSLVRTEIKLHHLLCPEPHWYLGMLGVSPECQGQGIGGKLLKPVLEKADLVNMPCYLETTTTAAVRFYQRHGFEVVYQGTFYGHEFWAMKRYPKS